MQTGSVPKTDPAASGMLIDLQRSSFEDGPGTRTTVFLKGCPLRCRWCHNPESQAFRPELLVHADRCTACGLCGITCPSGAVDGSHTDRARCMACGACQRACPSGARTIKGFRATTDEVMALVRRDTAFYAASGGGLTVSGGEPLSQPVFVSALLAAARAEGIHTCMETCGHAPWTVLAGMLPLVDLFLFDWKMTDPELHRQWTGQDNRLIRDNLQRLLEGGAAVLVRAPLIPGVNDDTAHLDELVRLSRLPGIQGVEVLPWHRMGLAKHRALDLDPALAAQPDADTATRARWADHWKSKGATAIRFA